MSQNYKLKLYEKDGKIYLDIFDNNSEFCLLLDFDPVVASQLGQKMADMARNSVAKVSDSKERKEIYETLTTVNHNAALFSQGVSPDRKVARRPHKPRSLQSKLKTQLALSGAPAD